MASWRILALLLLVLGVGLAGLAGAAWARDQGTGPHQPVAAAPWGDALGPALAAAPDGGRIGPACCPAPACASCAPGPSEAPRARSSAGASRIRALDARRARGRSIAPPTAPPRPA